ncbi:hypothetical protein K431DRAFT_281398 [Polychaeton citri CBS 116435]|uniref:Uncharacterized protein n=1 Tax=Polychaeton citri CBS 116435 TaxID=1314669 RepID=A0A9P4QET7_9PEZI|nr:hypothetical protein K431DRAFT_281398 [Polychaeton citri CBS 116435]
MAKKKGASANNANNDNGDILSGETSAEANKQTFSFECVAVIIAALTQKGGRANSKVFEVMNKVEGLKTLSGYEHQFRAVKQRAQEIAAKYDVIATQPPPKPTTPIAIPGAITKEENDSVPFKKGTTRGKRRKCPLHPRLYRNFAALTYGYLAHGKRTLDEFSPPPPKKAKSSSSSDDGPDYSAAPRDVDSFENLFNIDDI